MLSPEGLRYAKLVAEIRSYRGHALTLGDMKVDYNKIHTRIEEIHKEMDEIKLSAASKRYIDKNYYKYV